MTGSENRVPMTVLLEKIECINRAGIRSAIMTNVSKTNCMEVPGIIDAVVAGGANVQEVDLEMIMPMILSTGR